MLCHGALLDTVLVIQSIMNELHTLDNTSHATTAQSTHAWL